ncbi:uncharacterized protein LOC132192670 [Neocloeon triangulifer]|uniref:uncharacterized protein LOC132192670 n=1 Tax=Neocloeon triangulifer TaxID=2078957 RepID=UPI00286F51E4|nr:uncharacterized protein LOC132192670 [Neocloeon triangulifer]
MKFFIVLLAVAAAASALPTQEQEANAQQAAASEIQLAEGITIVRNEEAEVTQAAEGAPRAFDDSMIGRAARFLQSHSLHLDLKGADVVDAVSAVGRALNGDDVEEARKGVKVKKAGKLLGPLLIGILLKAALLAPLVLGAIALIAGKALIIGKIALLLSAVIGLKKLLSGHQKAVTYEVVSHPHSYSGHDTYSAGSSSAGTIAASSSGSYSGGSSSGWGRSVDAHQMAYGAQAP